MVVRRFLTTFGLSDMNCIHQLQCCNLRSCSLVGKGKQRFRVFEYHTILSQHAFVFDLPNICSSSFVFFNTVSFTSAFQELSCLVFDECVVFGFLPPLDHDVRYVERMANPLVTAGHLVYAGWK
jgi:hypothetical protein